LQEKEDRQMHGLDVSRPARALAVQHLTEAQRIISQFRLTPMLARINAALAKLG